MCIAEHDAYIAAQVPFNDSSNSILAIFLDCIICKWKLFLRMSVLYRSDLQCMTLYCANLASYLNGTIHKQVPPIPGITQPDKNH